MTPKNLITNSTETFLSDLAKTSPDAARAAEEVIGATSEKLYAARFSVAEAIHLLKAAKYVSSVDGFSSEEREGLRRAMESFKIPAVIIAHVEQFDVGGVSMDDIETLFPRGQLKAKFLIDATIFVAMQDGFSDSERRATIQVAERLGLRAELVHAYEARVRLDLAVMATGNEDLFAKSMAADAAQWALS